MFRNHEFMVCPLKHVIITIHLFSGKKKDDMQTVLTIYYVKKIEYFYARHDPDFVKNARLLKCVLFF